MFHDVKRKHGPPCLSHLAVLAMDHVSRPSPNHHAHHTSLLLLLLAQLRVLHGTILYKCACCSVLVSCRFKTSGSGSALPPHHSISSPSLRSRSSRRPRRRPPPRKWRWHARCSAPHPGACPTCPSPSCPC